MVWKKIKFALGLDNMKDRAEKADQELVKLGRLSPNGSFPNNNTYHCVSSFSRPGTTYDVDASGLTCSCPDFTDCRVEFPQNDPRRLCKHIVACMANENRYPHGLELFKGKIVWLAEHGGGFPKRIIVYSGYTDDDVLFAFMLSEDYKEIMEGSATEDLCGSDNAEWIDVFIRGERHGFCWSQCTWTQTSKNLTERAEIEEAILKYI